MIWRVWWHPSIGLATGPDGLEKAEIEANVAQVIAGALVFTGTVVPMDAHGKPLSVPGTVVRAFAPGTWASCEWIR